MAKLLIVDDSQLIADRIALALTLLGHECLLAADGLEAIQTYSKERPDGVFLDVAMPVMDGLASLRAIRELDPQARVTMVSGVANLSKVKEARSAGAVDFIGKPFDNQRLLSALTQMLE